MHNYFDVTVDGGKWAVALPRLVLCSGLCLLYRLICVELSSVCVCVCVWYTNRQITCFFNEWLNSGSYFSARSKSALGRSVGPLSLSFVKTDFPFFGQVEMLPIKSLVTIVKMRYRNRDVP